MAMNPLDSARFTRQVGFGLAPDEAIHEGVEPPETAGVAGIPELD